MPTPVRRPSAYVAALRASQDRLAALAGPLGSQEIRAASYDDGWSIAQVFSHLGSQAEISEKVLAAGLAGKAPPGPDSFPAVWSSWDARDPEDQVRASLAANERFVERLEELSDDQLDHFHVDLFGMSLDACGVLAMRLNEHAVHTWDVAVAFDPGAELSPDAAVLIVEGLDQTVRRVGKAEGPGFVLPIATTGPERYFELDVADDAVELRPTDAGSDASLVLTAAALIRLVYGRLDDEHGGRVAVPSPKVSIDDLRRVFPGF